ncbi:MULTISPECIES: phage tail tape measure protein [Haloarcula]|uniref:phage tail tape measure protein n=1 Tax=Haloarcula TaxID=2237 RepID=UPI000F8DEFB6|nr:MULTISPECIES: phage tail tape measure protein [Haloarcula]NHX41383.1 phage tail tape measure protein [Haloarcula sp. R1-2]
MSLTPSGDQELAVEITASDEGASEAFDGVAESAGEVKSAVAGASAVLAGAGVAALGKAAQAAADFEQAMVEVEKVTDPETAEQMSESIREMATEIPMAQNKLAGLAADAGRFGIEGPKNIENFTRSVAKMSEATNLSANEAGESLAKLSELTNTPISEVENLGSAINSLSNNYATSSQEIVDSMMRSSGALSQMGMSQTEIAGMSAAMNEVSESSRRAGTRMRRLSQEMMSPKKVGDLSSALGMTQAEFQTMREESPNELMLQMAEAMKEGGDQANALKNALSTTSRQALSGMAQNIDGTRQALEDSNKAYEEGTSLQKEFDASTDTFNAQLKLLKNQLRNVAIVMGNQILPVLTDALEKVMPLVKDFAHFNKQLNGMPAVIIALTAVLGGLAGVIATLGVSITGTLLPIIAIVGAVAAAGYALYKAWNTNFAGIRDVVMNTFKMIKQTFAKNRNEANSVMQTVSAMRAKFQVALDKVLAIVKFVVQNYTIPLIKRLRKIWKQNFSDIASETSKTMDFLLKYITVVGNKISAFWSKYGDEIMTITKTIFDFLILYVGTTMDAIFTAIKVVLALIRGDWSQAFTYIKEFAERTFNKILTFMKTSFLSGLKAVMSLIWKAIKAPFERIYNFLIGNSIVPKTFNEILDFMKTSFLTGLKVVMSLIWKAVKAPFERIYNFLIGNSIVPKTFNQILKFIRTNFLTGIKKVLKRVFLTYKKAFNKVKDAVLGIFDTLKRSVLNTMDTLGERILGKIRSVVEDFKDIFNNAIPDTLSIPEITIGGGDVDLPSTTIAGERIGGGDLDIPSEDIGGQSLDLPQLADGGIVDSATIAQIGEAGQEAVVPLDRLNSYLDTAYEAGTATATEAPLSTGTSSDSSSMTARLRVEGDGVLADIIREKAELVVEENEADKQNRLNRL